MDLFPWQVTVRTDVSGSCGYVRARKHSEPRFGCLWAQGTEESFSLGIRSFCIHGQLQLGIDLSGSHGYTGPRKCPESLSGVDVGTGGAKRCPPIWFFSCECKQLSGYFPFLPVRERGLDLCFGCHRKVFFMSAIYGYFLFLRSTGNVLFVFLCIVFVFLITR